MDPGLFPILFVAAAFAGWIDAVVGGGGLVQLPALLLAGAGMPVAPVLGTNKLAATIGTLAAAVTYSRRYRVDRAVVVRAGAAAIVGAGGGAMTALAVSSAALRPFILVVLVGVGVFVLARPGFGVAAADHGTAAPDQGTAAPGAGPVTTRTRQPTTRVRDAMRRRAGGLLLVASAVIGFYDGLVGPGTGTFLIITFTALLGLDFISALATVKLVNVGTNLGALLVFATQGDVLWVLGVGMSVCNVAGAVVGARMTMARGGGFVRVVLLVVITCMIVRLVLDQFA